MQAFISSTLERYANSGKQATTENRTKTGSNQLLQEEQRIKAAKQQNFPFNQTAHNELFEPLEDASGRSLASILIEQLILKLKDDEADHIKRQYIEHTLANHPENLPHTLIEIATAEIMGGSPQKGQATLSKSQIDEFSNTMLVLERQTAQALAALSDQLFLDPTYDATRCSNQENPATQSIITLFNQQTISLLNQIHSMPDPLIRMGQQIALIKLHQNADSCPLLSKMLLQHFIQKEIHYSLKNDSPISNLIYFSRAIKRHLEK